MCHSKDWTDMKRCKNFGLGGKSGHHTESAIASLGLSHRHELINPGSLKKSLRNCSSSVDGNESVRLGHVQRSDQLPTNVTLARHGLANRSVPESKNHLRLGRPGFLPFGCTCPYINHDVGGSIDQPLALGLCGGGRFSDSCLVLLLPARLDISQVHIAE